MHFARKIAATVLALCLLLGMGHGHPAFGLTIKEEEELSKEYLKLIKQHFELVEDPLIVDYVNAVGQKILATLPPQPFDYHFYVIRQDVYNAFATPAGHIFIYSGIIGAMQNEEELAALLAHEISHVVSRHISEKIERASGANKLAIAGMIAGILLGIGTGAPEAGQAVIAGTMAGAQSMMLAYSRGDEAEADQLGLNALYKAGYDGEGMVELFQILRSKQWFGSDQIPTYVMTHPAVEERIVEVGNRVETYNRKHGEPKPVNPLPFIQMQTRLLVDYGDPDIVLRRFRQAYEKDPESPLANYQYGLIMARTGQRTQALGLLQKALAAYPLDPLILGALGQVYFAEGRYEEALTVLKGAVNAAPGDGDNRIALARTQLEMGQAQAAADNLEAILRLKPDFNDAHFLLGKAYSDMGRQAEALYHLGYYYFGKGDLKKADFQLGKALGMAQDARVRAAIEALQARIKDASKDGASNRAAESRRR